MALPCCSQRVPRRITGRYVTRRQSIPHACQPTGLASFFRILSELERSCMLSFGVKSAHSLERGGAFGMDSKISTASAWLHPCVCINRSIAAVWDGSLATALPTGALRSPSRAIESGTVFSPNPVVRGFRTGALTFSVQFFRIEMREFPVPAFCFCCRFFQLLFPCATAREFLAARAARAICSASSRVLARRQSWVGGCFPLSRPCANVKKNRLGERCSALPPRPRSVMRMKPNASTSRIAGATDVRCIPYSTKSSVVTGRRPLSFPP